MSSITTIRISHEHGFIDIECLEEALEVNNLNSSFEIVQVGNKFQLNASQTTRDGNTSQIAANLKTQLNSAINTLLPTYTRLLAIKDFNSRKFILKNESTTSAGLVLKFEKATSLREGGQFERVVVTIRDDHTLTTDAINFKGRSCLDATRPFEAKIGKVIKREMKPESNLGIKRKTDTQDRQKHKLWVMKLENSPDNTFTTFGIIG